MLEAVIPFIPAILQTGAAWFGADATSRAASEQANAARDAARMQAEAADKALGLQREQFDQQRQDLEPWRNTGVNALARLDMMSRDPGQFGMGQFHTDPGYAFRLSEGMKALENSASARGGLLGSNHMKQIQEYGQGMASQEYQNAFNRYHAERNSRLNQLQSLAGVGQTALNQMGQAGQNFANNAGNLQVGGANALAQGHLGAASARSSGYIGTANTLNNALGNYLNYQQGQDILNRLAPPPKPGFEAPNFNYEY